MSEKSKIKDVITIFFPRVGEMDLTPRMGEDSDIAPRYSAIKSLLGIGEEEKE